MKKEFDQVGLAHGSGFKLTTGTDMIKDAAPYYQLQQDISPILNVGTLTTPFKVLPLNNKLNRLTKRTIDIVASLVFIVAVFPWLFPVIAVLIKLSSRGPVFFLQKRNKRNGELFTCIKFRSMYKNADADILPAARNDKRITKAGWFLRNSYLDELPQFLNVLMGDMSLIGPRPHMVSDNLKYDDLIKNYDLRHKVKPGITGLAQVMGYLGPTESLQEMEARVNLDIYYTRHWSPRLDISILFRTILKTLGIK